MVHTPGVAPNMRIMDSCPPLPSTGKWYSTWTRAASSTSFTSAARLTPGRAGTRPTSSPEGERTETDSRSATVFHTARYTSPAFSPTFRSTCPGFSPGWSTPPVWWRASASLPAAAHRQTPFWMDTPPRYSSNTLYPS